MNSNSYDGIITIAKKFIISHPRKKPFLKYSSNMLTDIENNSLAFDCVFHCEVEPDSKFRIARVWSDKQVIFEVRNVIHPANIATFKACIENKMTSFWFA